MSDLPPELPPDGPNPLEPQPGIGPGQHPTYPGPDPDRSRTTNRLLGWVLAALVVVIGLIVWSQIRDTAEPVTPAAETTTTAVVAETTEPGDTTTTSGDETTTTVEASTTTSSEASTTTTSTSTFVAPVTATEAVRSFVTAIAINDFDTAWELMAQPSRDEVGSRENLETYSQEYIEGYTAWAAASELAEYSNLVLSSGDGEMHVVTLAGNVTGEGVTEFGTFSMPVTSPDGESFFALPFLRAGAVEFLVPDGSVAPPAVVSNASIFEVAIPNPVTSVYFAVDDDTVSEGLVTELPDGSVTATTAYDELPPGDHMLTVFYVGEDSLTSDALPFTVR